MATNNDDIKWLYGKLKAKGYNIGTEQEFQNSLANEEDRKWYYEKAKGIGLNFGDMDDFDSLYAPQPIQSSTAQQQPAQKKDVPGSTTVQQTSQVAAGGTPMPEASVTEQPAMKPAWEIGENNSDSQRDNSDLLESHDGFGGGTDAFYGSEAHKRMQHYREVIKKRKREDEAKREEEMANRVAEMEFLKDATDFYTRMAEESKARKTARKESNDEYARMIKEQEQRNAEGRRNADLERSRGIEWDDPDYRRELDAIEPEYSSTAKEYSSAALEEASGLRPQHGVESTPEEKESAGEIDGSALEGEALASRQHRGMMSEEEARQLSTEAYDGKTILAYDKDRKGVDPVTGKGGYIDRTRYPAKARVMNEPEDIWSVSGKVDRTFTSDEPGGLPELSVTGISKAALKRRYEEYLRLHPELGDVAENSDKSRELMGSLRSEMIDEGRAVDEAFEAWKAENPHKVRNMSEEEIAGKREEIRADREFTRRMGNLDLERDYIFRRYGERTAELTAALRDEFESKGLKPDGNQWLYALDAALRGDEELKALNVQSYNLGKAAERYEDWVADGRQGSIVNFAQGVGGAVKDALMNPFGLVETQGSMIPLMHIKRKLARERRVGTDVKGGEEKDAKAGDGAESSLSQDEVLALESYFLNQETQGRTKMSLARNSGEFTGALAEMAAEFGLNPASGLAKRTLARIVAEVGKDGAMSLIRISSRLARMVGYKGVEVSGARVAANLGKVTAAALGEGAVMSATTQGLKNFNAAAGRTIAEPVYDDDGNLVDVNGEGAGSAVVKTGVSSALTNAAFVFPVTFGAKVMKGFDNMAKTMHVPFGNPVDALVKMKSGEAMSILTADAVGRGDMDPTWGDFADPEKNGELIMGLLAAELTSGAMRGTANVANGVRLRHSREMAKAEMMAKAMRGAEAFNGSAGSGNRLGDWVAIVKAVYEGEESTIVDALARVARDGSMTSEQKEAALDYARSAYRYIGADRAYEEWRTRGEREAAAREAEDDWNVVSEDTREMWEDESYTRGYEAARSAFTKNKPEEGRQNKDGAGTSGTTPRETEGKTPQETSGETSGQGSKHNEETLLAGQDGASSSGKDAAGLGADASGVDEVIREMNDAYRKIEDVFEVDSEYYRAELEENPWGVLENPEITQDQQEVVLDFINAKAAMNGMMDASGDVLEMKRKEIERSVEMRTHKKGNVIIPVVKNTGEEVYLVKGHVAMTPDGKGVDKSDSDVIVYLYNPISGKYESSAPEFIERVGEPISPEEELETAMSVIEQEQMSIFGNNAVASDESVEGAKPQQAPEALATANTEAYDRGYEQGISSTNYTDEELSRAIETGRSYLNEGSLDDFGRGRLEGLEYEQQRRAMEAQSVPEMPENVPNSTENAVSEGEIAPETVTSVENGQQTALSRIPLNEQGEPRFEAVDKNTAWDGLVEAVGGETDAVDIARAQVQQASTDLEALKKKPPVLKAPKLKGSPMAMAQAKREAAEQYQRDLAQYNQQIADTEARLATWNGIVGVYTSRSAELRRQQEEERRQRDAIAHDEAVARFEEEQRINAEKHAEQERIGVHAVNPKIREKWDSAPKIEGHTDAITLPDGSIVRGRYVLTEAGAASASHDVNNAYMPTEGFPVDENGQSVNDRDYMRDNDAQRIVEQMAGAYDNRALQTPVIVSKDGVVLSGNNRTMSGDLAARQGTDKAYVDYLREFGHKYGFTPEQVQGMSNPRLVFVPDENLPYDATTFSRFNAQEMKSQSKPEAAVKLGKIVPDNVFTDIANDISRYDRLSDYYADEKAVAHALGALMQAGVINDKQMPEMRTGTALSAAGKELIENTLIGKVFQTSPDAVRQIISMPSLRQSIVMGLNEIANNRTLARNGYDISEELAKAVDLVIRAKTAMPDVYTDGMPVSPFGRIQGLFDDEFGDSRVTDATALLLADILNSGKPSDLRKVLTSYNNDAAQASGGQLDIFSGSIPTKEEILTNVNEHFRNATPKEQQALVDNAIAERKRRAAEEQQQRDGGKAGEQTADALQRGAEHQQLNEPTEAQKVAGNYKMEHRKVDGYNVSIENAKGSVRRGKSADGTEWQTTMHNDYGYIRGTQGVDGDHIDVFLSDTPEEGDVFVIDQVNEDGSFDEHKVMYGFPTEQAARDAYLSNYEQGWTGLGAITHVSKEEFKKWIQSSKRKTKPFADYKSVRDITYNVDQTHTNVNEEGMIVDGEGKPLTLYHGTPNDVELVDLEMGHIRAGGDEAARYNGDGISFTPNRDVAIDYASENGGEGKVFEVNVTLKKPYYTLGVANFTPEEAAEFTASLQVKGYDGIINYQSDAMREAGANPNEVIVFDIKSATPAKAVCPVCGKTDIPYYHSHDVVCPQCNSDLSVFRQIDQLPDDKAPEVLVNIEKMEREISGKSDKLNTTQPKYDRTVPATPEAQRSAISYIIDFAKRVRNRVERAVIGGITKRQAKDFADNGIEVDETWVHSFESSAIVHNQGRHGDPHTEERAGQIAITHEDYARIPEILESYDRVTKSPNRSRSTGNEVIIYEKDFEDGYIYYLEEKRDKRKSLSFQTMYKKKKGTDSSDGLMSVASPSTPTAPSDNLSSISNGKFNTLSANKQTDSVESSESYTITPAVYVGKSRGGKPGKETPMHRVTFNRPLTAEQERVIKAFANEAIGEKKGRFATKRGWADREAADGSWLFRTEEDARKAGEMIANEEAVADAQPMTAEELREVVGASRTRNLKLKKEPINRVSLEDVMTDLSTKGETKLSDHAEPVKAEPEAQHEISDDEMQSLLGDIRDILGIGEDEGDTNIKFRDPGELTSQERMKLQSAGIRVAMALVERGTISFPDYATKMVGMLGDKIRPWLKSFYEGARWTPGYEKYAFTPTEQVATFDVQNFDKKQSDPFAQAAMIVEERKASTASEQAEKELIETRNKNRRENDKQREADTAALAEKAEAVAGEAESIAETSADAGELNRASELIDQTLDEVNDQLAVLGYYEAVEDDSKFHESYGYMLTAEKKAVADAAKLAKQLVNDLGIDIKVTSATTPLGRKSVKKSTAVRANIAPAGGDVIINLPLNEGRELAIYIGLDPVAEKGTRRRGDNLAVERILYRVENPNGSGMERWGHNWYAPVESTYADFLRRVKEITRDYLPKEKSVDEQLQEWADIAERGESPYTIIPEVDAQLAEQRKSDMLHNGYKIDDEVMWDRYGNDKWEKVKIEDFDADGSPIFEAVKGVMSEKGDWSRVKPADGIFGEAQRVARVAQEKKRSSRKKDVTLKPEQPVGDLFGGLFDNTQNSSNHEETEMGTRSGEAGGQRQQLKQDTQVGGDEPRRETERPAGEAGSGSTGMDSDADRAGSRGLHDVATQPALERLPAKERKNVHNNHVERGTEVAPKSESARIKANIAAIETMKKLEASGEVPTAADMKKLRAFSGWGGLGKAFSDWDTSRQLRQLLGDKLYDEGAEMSRNSAYFTPAYIVDAMWDIARAMGFKGGRVLEGSAGIGNVLGLMPQDLSERSYIRAVEKDPTTGKMLSLLYPDAVVDIDGFEKVKIETGTYDLVITNVPFVPGLKVADTSGDGDISKEFKTSIHDFCIAKNVRKLRDGGVGVFITTAGSMDGTGRLHKWLSNRENADIVGMFRMHNETFGGTNATSDIIVVRKRVNGVKSPNAIDCSLTTGVRTAEYDTGEKKKVKNVGEVPIIKTLSMSYNRYYVEHPEYMAGEMHFGFEKGDTSFRPESKGLYPIKEKDQSQLLSQWVEDMKQKLADTSEEPAPTVMNHRDEYVPTYDKVGNEVKTGTVVVDSQGRICVNYDGTARPLMSKLDNKNPKSADERIAQFNKNKVKGRSRVQVVQDYNAIKKALNDLLEYQKASDSDEGLQPKLKALNRAFDSFVATYGHLHGNNGLAWLKNDVDYPSVIALETYREEGLEHRKVYGKADIFSRRVVVRPEQPKATNVRDGVTLSIRQTGSLDTRYIAEQLGMSEADVRREVIEAGLGYENPLTHSMEAAHEYLSGNVREKMQQAEVNNEDGRYTPNITALRKVVPHNIPSHFIEFSIGSSWLRPELFEQYVKERTGASVKLTYAGGMWAMDKPKWTGEQDKSFGIRSEICDKIITGTELIEAAMTNRTIRVSKQQKDGPTISDPKATSACAAKVDEIRDDFKSWLRSRMESVPELAKEIEETYNNIFNNSAPMTIPDEYIPEYFDGAARVIGGKPIKMREHQAKAVVRGTMQSLMLAHEVGTGKTFTLITTAMEMRRLGTAKKPMIVVQNATLGQFVASAKALYPDARILSLEDRDRNAEGRKDFYAKIRYNDWDMVVIPQSVLERIPDHPDRERRYIEESIQEKMDVIEAMSKDREAGRAVAALKKDVENLRDQLNKLSDTETAEGEVSERIMVTSGSKPKKDGKRAAIAKENAKTRAEEMLNRATDDTLNFDDLGVDAILVDEAHEYKHLGFATAMQRGVKGVDPSYSKKCQGLYLKVKAVQEKSGGRNVIFATGTPISNTAAEVWTFMRYLLPREVMEGHNIWHFDDFVRNFGSIQQMLEFTTQGTYKENNRFAGYSNLPELARIWAGIADTVLTAEAGEVKSQIPELEGGQPTDLYLPQTNGLRAVLKFVRAQLKAYDEMSGQEKKENSHIPLVMYGIAKAAAIDARLVMANAPDDPHSKTNEAVRQTLRSLEDSKAYNGTVAIFADNYQRKNKGTWAVEFNLFDDIRTKLIAQGVPAEQVVIMRDGMTDKAKEKIFAKVQPSAIAGKP